MPRKIVGKRSSDLDGAVSVRGKAANGEGSVYFDASKGRWRATFRVDGEPHRRRVSGRSRAEVIARRAAAMAAAEAERRSTFSARTTVAQLGRWWLDTVAAGSVRPSSLAKYADRVARIDAELGDARVVELRGEQLAAWQAGLLERGLSAKTVADTRATLRQVLAQAVDHGLIATNPVERVRPPPKRTTSAARALSEAEVRRLVAAAAEDRLGAAVALLFVQGWRVGEVLGLAWDDVDLDAATATVRRAAVYVDGLGMQLGPTKTDGMLGVHHLAPGVVDALRRRRDDQRAEHERAAAVWEEVSFEGRPVPLVFTTLAGGLVTRQAVTRVITAAATSVGIDPAGIATHTGRRSVVTVLYAQEGVDLADVARHVGHASPATTATYVRDLGDRPAATARAAARRLDPASGE